MEGFQRVESKFAPIPDGTYTQYPTEVAFVISSNKGTPGVNFKMKIDEMDEAGQPQVNAGKTYFITKYLTEKTIGDFCQLLDMMGFKTNDQGLYLLDDGTLMPDFFKMKDKETIGFLVGRPFVGRLSCKPDQKYTKQDGSEGSKDEYNVRANWVVPPEGGRKVIQLSNHPNKAAAFAMTNVAAGANIGAGASMVGGAQAFGTQPTLPPGGVQPGAFNTGRGF